MAGRYKIKTISELCGFSPTLLRAWESRHGLLEPERLPSGHRLYTDDDLRVLRRVGQLLAQGQSIGEIAAVGRAALLDDGERAVSPAHFEPGPGLAPVEALKKEVIDAAIALDETGIRRGLDRLEALLTKREMIHVVPTILAQEIGSLWVSGRASIASEHLLSSILRERVTRWAAVEAPITNGKGKVICAGFPDEQHELGLLLVSYELRAAGWEVVCLGGQLPFVDLDLAIGRLRPAVVCLSVTRPELFAVHRPRFEEVLWRHPKVRFVVGGAGTAVLERELTELKVIGWPPHRSLNDLLRILDS